MKNIVNIINFIRAVEPRPGRSVDMQLPMREQIKLMKKLGLRGTFLLQYDAMIDPAFEELIEEASAFCEIGLWLEIVQPQVEAIGLEWKGRYPWDWYNDVGFLIGYEPEQRRQLIDVAMEEFKTRFGKYPASVGSWHIDAVSFRHLEEKYHITAACICRDQVGTDGYTMQGGYYNQAYYPSVNNMFCPASTEENQINIPVFRMLGSDPVLAYDYQTVDYGYKYCPTLEPAQLARFNDWTDWFMEELYGTPNGLCFQYTHAGQENSFGWPVIQGGIEYQFPLIAKMAEEGKVSVMTLGESGAWYKENFKTTPAGALIAKKGWKHPYLSSVWYYSKFYRVNLLMDRGVMRIRDMYVFDEGYREHYLEHRCDTHACEFRNLPVMDGAIYSSPEKDILAGIYFTANGKRIVWKEMQYAEPAENTSTVTLTSDEGVATVTLGESGFAISTDLEGFALVPDYDREKALNLVDDSEKFSNRNNTKTNLSFIEGVTAKNGRVTFRMNGFDYGFEVVKGCLCEDLTVTAEQGTIQVRVG